MKKTVPETAILVPDNAERVFQGNIFDVYQWQQAMFDGSTQTFEMLKRPDTVIALAVHNEKIVMIEDEQPNRPPVISLPGGRVDDTDESWLAAAQREMREETGTSFAHWRLVLVMQSVAKIEWFKALFVATELTEHTDQNIEMPGERIRVFSEPYETVRAKTLEGTYRDSDSLINFFRDVPSLDHLLALPEFTGKEVDR